MFTDVFYSLVSGFSSYFLPLFLFLDTVTIATSNPNTKQRHSWKLCVRVQVYVCGYVTGSNCLTQPATSTERERGWSRPIRGQNTGMSASGTDVGFMSYLLTSYLYMCFFQLPTWVGKWTCLSQLTEEHHTEEAASLVFRRSQPTPWWMAVYKTGGPGKLKLSAY